MDATLLHYAAHANGLEGAKLLRRFGADAKILRRPKAVIGWQKGGCVQVSISILRDAPHRIWPLPLRRDVCSAIRNRTRGNYTCNRVFLHSS
ncbi:hypothetical protein ACFL2Q_04545 [Thermodesulfobacteriota bacterium]